MTDASGDVQRAAPDRSVNHRDIPDEVVKRAQLYDAAHWREDRNGERGGSWGSAPPDQVRRLLWGAFGQAAKPEPADPEELARLLREWRARG